MSESKRKVKEYTEEDFKNLFACRHERPGKVFKDLLKNRGLVVAPGGYNARGARSAAEIFIGRQAEGRLCSFNAFYFGGWSVSAMDWWRPDMGFHDRSMMALKARYAVEAAFPLSSIVDAETGFTVEPVAIGETVRLYHDIGVGLAHLEDQATRRCGNLGGKACVPIEEMETKIRLWLMASEALGSSMELMARTDALTAADGGLDKAIERGKRYMDVEYKGRRPLVLWADAMQDPRVIDRWIKEIRKHDKDIILGINYSPNKDWTSGYREKFKAEPPTYADLYRNGEGFQVIWHTILQARADAEASWNVFDDMAENGAEALWKLHDRQRTHPLGDSQGMSNAPIWQALDKHAGGEAAKRRYDNSEGYKGKVNPS